MRIQSEFFILGTVIQLSVLAFAILIPGLSVAMQETNTDFQATRLAADKGDAKAQFELARCYARGIGVQTDRAKAVQYMRQSADQGYTDAEAMPSYFYGRGWGVPRNVPTAVSWYRKAADQGNAVAQYAMGNFYANGTGVTNDMQAALQWWLKAAKQNNARMPKPLSAKPTSARRPRNTAPII